MSSCDSCVDCAVGKIPSWSPKTWRHDWGTLEARSPPVEGVFAQATNQTVPPYGWGNLAQLGTPHRACLSMVNPYAEGDPYAALCVSGWCSVGTEILFVKTVLEQFPLVQRAPAILNGLSVPGENVAVTAYFQRKPRAKCNTSCSPTFRYLWLSSGAQDILNPGGKPANGTVRFVHCMSKPMDGNQRKVREVWQRSVFWTCRTNMHRP